MKSTIALCFMLPALALSLKADTRVVDGSNANIANHPWQASLRINNNHACGAVLISATRALTAAHCGGGSTSTYSILAGTTDRTVQVCQTCALRNPITAFHRHPGFINNPSAGYPSDIATVWFHSIADNVNIKYVAMSQAVDGDYTGQSCVVSGWGRQAAGGDLPTTLQEGQMTVISTAQCSDVWGSNRIRDDQICAQASTVSLCGGDQGGPLICGGKLAGVFSWSEANCGPNFPAVFIRVSAYHDWIVENGTMILPAESLDYSSVPVEELMASLME